MVVGKSWFVHRDRVAVFFCLFVFFCFRVTADEREPGRPNDRPTDRPRMGGADDRRAGQCTLLSTH